MKIFRLMKLLLFLGTLNKNLLMAQNASCSHQRNSVIDCHYKKIYQRIVCGRDYSLGSDYSSELFEGEKHKLIKLNSETECIQISISPSFHLNEDVGKDHYRWSLNVSYSERTSVPAFLLISTQKKENPEVIPEIRQSALITMGYVSHFLSLDFFQLEANESINSRRIGREIYPEKSVAHQVDVVFNVTDDREIESYALQGHQIIRSTIEWICVQYQDEEWTENGCKSQHSTRLNITCNCQVTSGNGQTRLGVKTRFRSLGGSENAMPTYFSLTLLSTLFLMFTLIVLIKFRRVYKDTHKRFVVQVNLTISLLLRHSFLLTGFGISLFNPLERTTCQLMAVFHLYFLITTVFWVLVEGVVVYLKVCRSSPSVSVKKISLVTVSVWSLPFIMVSLLSAHELIRDNYIKSAESFILIRERVQSISSDPKFVYREMLNYRKFDYCWATSPLVTLAVGIPVTLSLIVNTIILVWVGIVVWKIRSADKINTPAVLRSKTCATSQTMATFRAVSILTAVLGIPWLLSLLFNLIDGIEKMTSLVPSYIHFVCVFLQGPALFYVYCAQKKELRVAIRRNVVTQNVKNSIGSKRSHHGLNSASV